MRFNSNVHETQSHSTDAGLGSCLKQSQPHKTHQLMKQPASSRRRRRALRPIGSPERIALTTLVCAGAAANVAGQTAPAPGEQQANTSPIVAPEVVVTGQAVAPYKPQTIESPKLQGPLRDIPQTITVIPKELIKEQGATSLRDVLRNVPGISIQAGEGGGGPAGDNLSIRGFNARTDLFVDNVRDFGGYSRDPFNIEQVEVFKGPTSSTAGRGSTGGSINLVSKSPVLDPFYVIDASAGSDNFFRGTFDINQPLWTNQGTAPAPITGKSAKEVQPIGKGAKAVQPVAPAGQQTGAALRLNGLYHTQDTPGRDYVENERWGIAGSLAFGLGTDTRATLSYFHLQQDNQPDYGIPWVPATINNAAAGTSVPITRSLRKYIDEAPPVSFDNYYGSTERDYEDIQTDIATFVLEHDFNEWLRVRNTFRAGRTHRDSIITAPRFNGNGTSINRQVQSRDQEDNILANLTDFTAEFDTGSIKHTVTTGFEFIREESENFARVQRGPAFTTDLFHPNPTEPFNGSIVYNGARQEADVNSAAVYLFDKIELNEHFQLIGGLRWDYLETDYTSMDEDGEKTDLSRSDDMLSWRAALVYKPVEQGSIYFSYGTSFNPSTELLVSSSPNGIINQFDTDPEENRSYEVGTKWDLFEERLSVTAALFRTEKTNARTEDPANEDVFELTGEQVVQGGEIGLAGSITDHWRLFAGYTYLDSEIEASLDPDEVGNDVPNTPKHSFSLWTVYDLPGGFQIGGGAQFVDDRFNNNANQRVGPSYWLFDAMVGYQINENLNLRVNFYNIADEEYIDRVGGGHFVPGAGRSVTASVTYKF
jgi:catecholate siderophore receptor